MDSNLSYPGGAGIMVGGQGLVLTVKKCMRVLHNGNGFPGIQMRSFIQSFWALSLPGEMVGGVGKEGEEKHQVLVEIFGGRAQGRHHMVEDRKVLHGLPSDF